MCTLEGDEAMVEALVEVMKSVCECLEVSSRVIETRWVGAEDKTNNGKKKTLREQIRTSDEIGLLVFM